MVLLVQEYKNYLELIPELIAKTDYKASYFIKILGLKRPTYYRKLRENAFTTEEVQILTNALFPKEAYLQEIKQDLEEAKKDYKKGRVVDHSKVMQDLRDKYL